MNKELDREGKKKNTTKRDNHIRVGYNNGSNTIAKIAVLIISF